MAAAIEILASNENKTLAAHNGLTAGGGFEPKYQGNRFGRMPDNSHP